MALLFFLNKKSLPAWEALLFVFALFITRRNASQSGEGKKECEEKHFIDHRCWLPVVDADGNNML
ncbi:hypothetical protein DXZ79_04725 [Yersinia rochesterensis]|uniref:Uncharacterized protein n=1 Tax=Yersinia rochesterensis TaxID=1604335 RepID=A0A8D4SR10_9GAMM|nr:hypothetical protein DXZ79_04725 [Yersinia rochesterensis]